MSAQTSLVILISLINQVFQPPLFFFRFPPHSLYPIERIVCVCVKLPEIRRSKISFIHSHAKVEVTFNISQIHTA